MRVSRIALLIACVAAPAGLVVAGNTSPANAGNVASVPIGSASTYSVLGASTVTSTGTTELSRSLGLFPGTSITGFPPGVVLAPAVIDIANAAAQEAQSDLTAGYINAAGRPLTGTTPADLAGQTVPAGVYATSGKGSLDLNGTLVLDGLGDTDSVFIFQTDSTLTTGSGSSVILINGAQACRVYWVVGSSATLGTGSSFVGTILAQASITVTTGVSVRGRALARTGAVTLDSNVFTPASCRPPLSATATTVAGGNVTTIPGNSGNPAPGTNIPSIPATGSAQEPQLLIAALLLTLGIAASMIARRRRLTH